MRKAAKLIRRWLRRLLLILFLTPVLLVLALRWIDPPTSTLTQQTAKNLFLWQGRSWFRKGLEAGFTLLLEAIWPKSRIL